MLVDLAGLALGAALAAGGFTAGRRFSPGQSRLVSELQGRQEWMQGQVEVVVRDLGELSGTQTATVQDLGQLRDQLEDEIRSSHEGRERLHQAQDQLAREQVLVSAQLKAFNQRVDEAVIAADQLKALDQKLEEMQRFIVQAAEQAQQQAAALRQPRPAMDTEALMAALQSSQAEFRRRQQSSDTPMPAGGL